MEKRIITPPLAQKAICAVFMALYLLLLTWIILFKANPGRLQVLFDPDFRSISLIPSFNAAETLLNAAVFAPFGVFVCLLSGRIRWLRQTALIASVSLFYEVMQYILCLGTTDITDLISNTLGGVLGIALCRFAAQIFGVKSVRILGVAACAGTVLLYALTWMTL